MVSIAESWQKVIASIGELEVETEPYAHVIAQGLLPDDFYADMVARLPTTEEYVFMHDERGRDYGEENLRCVIDFYTGAGAEQLPPEKHDYWHEVTSMDYAMPLAHALIQKFQPFLHIEPEILARGGGGQVFPKWLLTRSLPGYGLGPHPDSARKLLAALFYLPPDDSMTGHGTVILKPNVDEPRDHPTQRGRFHTDDFDVEAKAPFAPNTFLAFARTPDSYHMLDPIGADVTHRDALMFNIMFE